jgi:hypothetical protein
MKPVRQELVADVVGDLPPEQPVVVTERQLVRSLPDYTLEWVRFRARFTDIEVGGYLATPNDREEGAPAVLSLDGNYDQGWLYGLKPAPFVYLNQYGDALARSGYVVFSPYMPSTLADGWGALLGAKTGYRQNLWSYLVPLYMSGIDLLRSEPAVDKDRIAVYGISFAGYAALLTAAMDERIAAVVYSNPFEGPGPQLTVDGAYFMPNIWKAEPCRFTARLYDGSLIAPRAFIWENGIRDSNVPRRLDPQDGDAPARLYTRLGIAERFKLARHDGGHETRPQVTIPLLDQLLRRGD